MALTIKPKILGQEISYPTTYCYLYEPLEISVLDSSEILDVLTVNLEIVSTETGLLVETLDNYVSFDINKGVPVTLDLMKIARQHYDANVFKIGEVDNIVSNKESIVSKYKYNFKLKDEVGAFQLISKLPIIGGREFLDFTPVVDENVPTNEFEKYGISEAYLSEKWDGVPIINVDLASASITNSLPTITRTPSSGDKEPCAFIIWKSRLGGWMYWGFELMKESSSKKYDDSLEVGLFEATGDVEGIPYVPVDFTGITTNYKKVLKSLDLTMDELKAVDGINSTVVCYFMKPDSDVLELMRVTASVPIDTNTDGGDFTVTLSSISTSSQKAI